MGEEQHGDLRIGAVELVELHYAAFGQPVLVGKVSRDEDAEPSAAALAEGDDNAIGMGQLARLFPAAHAPLNPDACLARQDRRSRERNGLAEAGAKMEHRRHGHREQFLLMYQRSVST
jgi:hypothetical protein